ncbi:MAG: SDR family oxidoreductase [Pseudomonadota bacterium]
MTTILITGAGRGIGFELARQSLAKGWRVFGSVRSEDATDKLTEALPDITPLIFDVTDGAAVEKAAASIDEPIDVLVNNAGVIGPARQSTLDMDFHGFETTLAINTIAPLRVAQAFLPLVRKSKAGRIVTITSQMGRLSSTASDRIAYRASKAAVNKVFQGLATDLRREDISVLLVHPGWVQTDMGGQSASITPQDSASGILALIDRMDMSMSGHFIDWDGVERGW